MPRGVTLVVPPTGEPLSLQEAKAHCRVDQANDDGYLTSLVSAARRWIENATGRALVSQTLRLGLDRFPRYSSSAVWQYNSDAIWQQRLPVTQLSGQWYPDRAAIRVPRPPLQQLVALTYSDGTGTPQTLIGSIAAGVTAGTRTVTPATMTGIVPGLSIIVDVGLAQETVTVAATTSTTWTATFALTHAPAVPYCVVPMAGQPPLPGQLSVGIDTSTEYARLAPSYGQIWPIVLQQLACVQVLYVAGYGPVTTVPGGVAGSGSQTVAPAAMTGIYPGTILSVAPGTTAQEDVAVASTTATTFTAAFGQPHPAGVALCGVPEALRQAVRLLVGHWYENREAVAAQPQGPLALALDSILDSFATGEYE